MTIFVIGDESTVLGFALIGIEGEVVHGESETRTALGNVLKKDQVEIVLITEACSAEMQEEINQLKMTTLQPVVVEIPSSEPAPPGRSLRRLVQEVIGISLGS